MKDPNWRDRKSMSGSSESFLEDRGVQRHFLERFSTSSIASSRTLARTSDDSESNDIWTLSSFPTPDKPGKTTRERHDITGRLHGVWPSEAIMQSQNSDNFGALIDNQKNVFSVIGHVQLENRATNGQPLSLIEVIPYDPKRHDPDSKMVHIWRQPPPGTEEAGKESGSEQVRQLPAPSPETADTPKKTRSSPRQPVSPARKTATRSEMSRAREAVLRDSAVADVSRTLRDSNKTDRLPRCYSFEKADEATQKAAMPPKADIAFQRMLQKLHRSSDAMNREESGHFPGASQAQRRGDSSYQASTDEQGSSATDTRKRDARVDVSADSGYESSRPQCLPISSHPSPKSNTFNPKAREFMSLVSEAPKENIKPQAKFKRPAIEDLFGTTLAELDISKDMPANCAPRVDIQEDTAMEDASSAPIPEYIHPSFTPWQGASPMPAPSVSPISPEFPMPSPTNFATWTGGQSPAVTLQLGTMAPGGTWLRGIPLLPVSSVPPPFAPAITPAGFFNMNPLGNFMPGAAAAMSGPTFPAPPQNPGPVSKPRAPNAVKQQQYEAWIEWRKANEPGYAMECKMRQQRRSQRNNTSKQKSESVGNHQTGLVPTEVLHAE